MSNERARQKKAERKRKAREERLREARRAREPDGHARRLVELGARQPFGPAFVSGGYDDLNLPALATVLVTRQLPDGRLLPGIGLVDRTCLGVKSGFAARPVDRSELTLFLRDVFRHTGHVPCEPLVAQSIVFHALDFASRLGFRPDPDFPLALFGPRPEALLATPWSKPERPWYFEGPDDDAPAILARLQAVATSLGYDGFDVASSAAAIEAGPHVDPGGALLSRIARAPRSGA